MGNSAGFSLIELVIIMVIVSIVLGFSALGFSEYAASTASRQSADVFAHDLTLARTTAIRERNSVTVRFNESARTYQIRTSEGRIVLNRDFSENGEVQLGSIDLDMPGDSLVFSARGIVQLADGVGPLLRAEFEAGETTYVVSFNAMGVSEVAQP